MHFVPRDDYVDFSDLVPPDQELDAATVSDPDLLAMLERHYDVEPGTFGGYKITRPETGNILVTERDFTYGA